jgi:hypothetical protein
MSHPAVAKRDFSSSWIKGEHHSQDSSGIVWLAADAPQNQTGKFWRDRKVIPW